MLRELVIDQRIFGECLQQRRMLSLIDGQNERSNRLRKLRPFATSIPKLLASTQNVPAFEDGQSMMLHSEDRV